MLTFIIIIIIIMLFLFIISKNGSVNLTYV